MADRLCGLLLAAALLAGQPAGCRDGKNPGSPNGSCEQTPGQCGYRAVRSTQ